MNNSNSSAMPSDSEYKSKRGLTKREHIATLALQGILSNATQVFVEKDYSQCVEDAVECADLLLARLAK